MALAATFLADGAALGVTAPTGQAYRNESRDQALATDRQKFPALLDAPALTWPARDVGAQIKGYLSPETAVVGTGSGRRGLLESSIPLRGQTPDGTRAPIDLGLVDSGSASYAPRSAATAIRIPANAQDKLRFPDASFGVGLAGAQPQPATISQNKAFFPNVVPDGDLVIEPKPQGAELSLVLRSPAAPSELPLGFDLASGQELKLADPSGADGLPPGSVELVDGARRIAAIYPASATDADGQSVPASYKLDGDRLLIELDTSGEINWPVLVDPPIGVYDNNGTSVCPATGCGTTPPPPPGFYWPGWSPAAYTPAADTTGTTWSYCNNQASNPSKKFYFCQGSLTGSAGAGGALYIKANGTLSYALNDYAQWAKQARADAYIYRLDAAALDNVGASQAALAVGVRTADASNWETGGVLWGDGLNNNSQGAITNPAKAAAYRTPDNTAYTGATRYLFVHAADVQHVSTAPATPITPGDRAVFRIVMEAGSPGTPLPYVRMGGAATYSSELYAPTLELPTHTNAPDPTHWVPSYTDTVTTKAHDKGLGMGTISMIDPAGQATTVVSDCPQTGAGPGTTNSYDGCKLDLAMPGTTYTAPEGIDSYSLTAQDLVGNQNHGNDQPWSVKVDQSPPNALNLSGGTLTTQDGQPVNGSYSLNFSATDQYSGVAQAKFYVDDLANPVDVRTQQPSCDTSGCPTSETGQFTFDTNALNPDGSYRYSEGYHTLQVAAEDPLAAVAANHVRRSQSFRVLVDRTQPAADTGGELDWAADEPRLTTDHPDLQVSATDENDSSSASSGVRSIEVKLDGVDSTPSTQLVQQTCATDSCSLDHSFPLDTSQLGDGQHTVDVLITDFAGNVGDQSWTFTIDRHTPLPPCSDPSSDPNGCRPDPPSGTSPTCIPGVVTPQAPGGSFLTGDQAVAAIQQSAPDAVAVSDTTSNEGLTIAPALTSTPLAYRASGVAEPGSTGSSFATMTVGAGTSAVCISPTSTSVGAPLPKLVNGTALVYADTAPSTDTVLRPTPFGIQELQQIRDSSAPEARTYQVSLQGGQFLQQLDSGAIAVVDPSIASVSGSLPPYDQGTPIPDTSADPIDSGGDHGSDPSQDAALANGTVDGVLPDDPTIAPQETQFQYDSQRGLLAEADQAADGQEVAIITPPWATDATGVDVPTDVAISSPNTFTITTHYQEASYAYPVTTSEKAMTTSTARRPKVTYGLDVSKGTDLFAHKPQPPSDTSTPEGAPLFREKLRASLTRFNMPDEAACDTWDGPGKDLTNHPPKPEDYDTNPKGPAHQAWDRCVGAIDFVNSALRAGLTPYISFINKNTRPTARGYANAVDRLWQTVPFKKVKYWGPTNEPDLQDPVLKKDVGLAVAIWRGVKRKADTKDPGASAPHCNGCHIVAGEFAVDLPGGTSDTYIQQYMDKMNGGTSHPHYWAQHDYYDLYNGPSHVTDKHGKRRTYTFLMLHQFIANLDSRSNLGKRTHVLMSEGGVQLRHGGRTHDSTPLNDSRPLQVAAARSFLKMRVRPRLEMVNYYEIYGNTGDFDSAIVTPQARGPLNQKQFRPVYCVLTRGKDDPSLCPAIHSCTVNDPNPSC